MNIYINLLSFRTFSFIEDQQSGLAALKQSSKVDPLIIG